MECTEGKTPFIKISGVDLSGTELHNRNNIMCNRSKSMTSDDLRLKTRQYTILWQQVWLIRDMLSERES